MCSFSCGAQRLPFLSEHDISMARYSRLPKKKENGKVCVSGFRLLFLKTANSGRVEKMQAGRKLNATHLPVFHTNKNVMEKIA